MPRLCAIKLSTASQTDNPSCLTAPFFLFTFLHRSFIAADAGRKECCGNLSFRDNWALALRMTTDNVSMAALPAALRAHLHVIH